jgi:short-subunit dehydrogenase
MQEPAAVAAPSRSRARVNIVVVGTGNIGLTTAQHLAPRHRLVLIDRRRHAPLESFLASNPELRFIQADACDPAAMRQALAECFPGERLDRLLCTVGTRSSAAADSDFDGFARDFETNLYGNQNPVMAALPRMKEAGTGKIVVISSTSGHHAANDLSAYGPSKWALESFCGGLRSELREHGVTVDVVTLTNLRNRHSEVFDTESGLDPERVAGAIARRLDRSAGASWTHPTRYRSVHWLERLAPGWLDTRAGLRRSRRAEFRALQLRSGLITGASSGLGRELARRYAPNLEELWLVARTRSALEALKEELDRASECQIHLRVLDMGDLDAVVALADEVGSLDLLVNNAGWHLDGEIADTSIELVRELMSANFLGPARLTGRLLEHGRLPKKVVNVLSTTAIAGRRRLSAYGGSKAALWCFTRSLRRVAGANHQILEVIPATFASPLLEHGVQVERGVQVEMPERNEARSAPAARVLDARAIAERIAAAEASGRERLMIPLEARLFLLLEALAPPLFRRLFP